MKNKYYIGITIAIIVLITNQIFIQFWLAKKQTDAIHINLAGKQRMLSQKTNLQMYQWADGSIQKSEIEETFHLWKKTHLAFLNGDEELEIKALEDTVEVNLLKSITPDVEYIGGLLSQTNPPSKNKIQLINDNQAHFLVRMDKVVKLLQEDSDRKLNFIIIIEIILLLLSLIVITLEVIYIYMPIEKNLITLNKNLKKSNHRLSDINDQLLSKNKELEQLTYIVAHDIQSPLKTINSFTTYLINEPDLSEKKLQIVNHIQKSTKRLQQMVKGILDLSRVKTSDEKTLVNPNEIIQDIIADIEQFLEEKKASISFKDLHELYAYSTELRLVFQNLIINGIKFCPVDRTPKIEVRSEETDHHIIFYVTDNGNGIPKEDQEQIFKVFKRLHQTDVNGSGLGLGLCSKVIDLHKGKIWVEDSSIDGSTFAFSIPK